MLSCCPVELFNPGGNSEKRITYIFGDKKMKKGIVSVVMALVFAVSVVGTGMAATVKCTVDSVDGDKVTMTCKKASSLKKGDKVKVKKAKKKAGAVEGC